jgi:hypothetical protein
VHSIKTTAWAALVLLAGLSGTAQAQSAQELQNLKGTVEELRQQLNALRGLLKDRGITAPAAPAAGAEPESQESIDARSTASKADIQGLRTDLENYKYDMSRQLERNVPSVTRNTKIGGSVTLRYDAQDPAVVAAAASSGNNPTTNRNNGFNAPGFGLNFAGTLYRDYSEGRNLTYRLALSGSNTATSSSSTVNLTDAFASYSFQPNSGNLEDAKGTITLGQQVIPFGQDAQAIDPEVKAVIGNAGFVTGLGMGTRQVGVVVSGDYDPYVDFTNNYRAPLLAYSVGVFNGNGPNRADNNNAHDYVGRLVYTLPVDYSSWFRQLQLGTSYYKGNASLAAASALDANGYGIATAKGRNDRYGFDVNWTHLPYSVSYEWAEGKKQLFAATKATPDALQRQRGQYINFGYTWGEQFLSSSKQQGKYDDAWPLSYQAFVRFDQWDPNLSSTSINDRVYTTTVGLNVFFAETSKLQINYLRGRNQLGAAAPTAAKPAKSDTIQAQLSTTF